MKNLSFGEYVCCIEPGSNFVRGRDIEKSKNNLRILRPQEITEFLIEIEILDSNEEIDLFKKQLFS